MSDNSNLSQGNSLKRELGLTAAIAIVIGNTIGSGIFMSPTSMALVSDPIITIIAWIITAIGSILLALSFTNLASRFPETGGPIVYTEKAFGSFAAFIVSWLYWVGSWVGNAAIITACINYLSHFFPVLQTNGLLSFLISSAIVWGFTYINIRGVKEAGFIGIITTVLKILPLIVFLVIAFSKFDAGNFITPSGSTVPHGLSTLPPAIAVALWSFVGLESCTVTAGEIKDAEKIVKKSTIIGISFAGIIYLLISIAAAGAIPQDMLMSSTAPLAQIIDYVTGSSWGGNFIAIGAIISTLGATSGWLMTTARSSFSAAEKNIFPKVFCKVHSKYKTPVASLVISGLLTNLLLILNYVSSLNTAFNFMILLATLSFLPIYTLCVCAEVVLLFKKDELFTKKGFKKSLIVTLSFAYSIYAIYGSGFETVTFGFILMLLGIPFYVYMMFQNGKLPKDAIENKE